MCGNVWHVVCKCNMCLLVLGVYIAVGVYLCVVCSEEWICVVWVWRSAEKWFSDLHCGVVGCNKDGGVFVGFWSVLEV